MVADLLSRAHIEKENVSIFDDDDSTDDFLNDNI
jgi:hypothetical protein